MARPSVFLDAEMDAGSVRRTDARLLLLAAYYTVIGVATEVEVLRALGEEPTGRSLVRRPAELLGFLRSALVTRCSAWMCAMTIRTSPWPPGTPCWADLTVPDPDRAKAFYAAVLGWSYTDAGDEFGGYVSALVDGSAVAGIGPHQQPGPVAWTLYLATVDVDATAELVTAHGGTVILPAGDVGDLGRMAMATDPAGAVFGVWQAGTHIGAALANEPGGIAWEDLRSTDPAAAWSFYEAVFGHETRLLEMAGPDYRTFHHPGDDAPLGGMGGMMGAEGASHWLVYFSVASTDDAVAAAEGAGGIVVASAFDSPFGRMAGVADPFGARFMLHQNTGQPQPDRAG